MFSVTPLPPTIQKYDGSFDVGARTSIECTSTGSRPTASLLWFLDGQRLGDSDFVVIPAANGTSTITSVLTRTFTRDQDGALLTCAVTNTVLELRGHSPLTANVTLRASCKLAVIF